MERRRSGNLQFFGQDAATQNFSLPIAALVEGDNTVKFIPTGIGNDVSLVRLRADCLPA